MVVGAAFSWGSMAAVAKVLFRDRGVDPLLLVALYVLVVQRQRVSRRLVLSLVFTVVGCALMVRAYDPGAVRLNLLGMLAGVGTAFAFYFYILSSRAALRSMRSWTLVACGCLATSLVWLPIVPPWQVIAAGFPPGTWWAFLAIARGRFAKGLDSRGHML